RRCSARRRAGAEEWVIGGVSSVIRAGRAAAGQITESVSGRQTSNREMHIRAAAAGVAGVDPMLGAVVSLSGLLALALERHA
ncbi:hypothetical protein ACMAVG_005229, partial [Burkholderia cenocepacia]